MRFSNVLASATVFCVFSAAGALAQNGGFCGNYAQTWSNAGQCDACRLMIADNPEIQTYFVEANNGWSAELTWAHGDPSDAVGRGAWNDASDDHSRQGFDIDLDHMFA